MEDILEEYVHFSKPKTRAIDKQCIKQFSVAPVSVSVFSTLSADLGPGLGLYQDSASAELAQRQLQS